MRYLTIVLVLLFAGCAKAQWREVKFNSQGEAISETEIVYKVVGKRELNGVDVDAKKGLVKLGSSKGDAGQLGTVLGDAVKTGLNLSRGTAKAMGVPVP